MKSEKHSGRQFNRLFESISIYRSRRRNLAEINHQNDRSQGEIDDLIHKKVVRQLHDGLSQTVSALAMRVNFARRLMDEDPLAAQEELKKVEDLARDTTREIRNLIFILQPTSLDGHNLTEALGLLVEKMDELFSLKIELEVDAVLVNQLPLTDQKVIYYLVEEAIGSARKRNGSNHLTVRLNEFDQHAAQLVIEDRADSSSQMGFPFQSNEMESIQEFSELISGSVRVLEGGTKIQILFPLSEWNKSEIQPES